MGSSGGLAGLYPTVARINHSCWPNVVWSGLRGKQERKEILKKHKRELEQVGEENQDELQRVKEKHTVEMELKELNFEKQRQDIIRKNETRSKAIQDILSKRKNIEKCLLNILQEEKGVKNAPNLD